MVTQDSPEPAINPIDRDLRASLWLEQAAHALYSCEAAEHPERNLPTWDQANRHLRADARYRAMGAHQRSKSDVKAVLVERIAQTLALADGFIWPDCESPIRPQWTSEGHYAATVAQRRQLYRHKARTVITATFKYLDMDAAGEPEEQRTAILASARQQQLADVNTVQLWRQSKGMAAREAFPADAMD